MAERDNFAGISSLLAKWREQEAALLDRIQLKTVALEPLPEAIDVIQRLGELAANLKKADRVKLAHAIQLTVSSVTIGTRTATTGEIEHPELFGELTIHESLAKKPMPIPDEAIGRRKIWREISELVRNADEPLHLADFCEHIGTDDPSQAAYHVRRAERAGLIKKIGHQGGWTLRRQA